MHSLIFRKTKIYVDFWVGDEFDIGAKAETPGNISGNASTIVGAFFF